MNVLITGFDPFGGESVNPSWLAAERLDGSRIGRYTLVAGRLPTEFGRALETLHALVERHDPCLVIAVGQAGGRDRISLERVAINIDDARIPDNAGRQPIDAPIDPGGEAAYFSGLPIKAMLRALQQAGVPAEVSNSAGTFVCNHVFYGLMALCGSRPGLRGGFIHIPYLPGQAVVHPGKASMALDDIVRALTLCVQVALDTGQDLKIAAGTEC